jgi:hypothetical protein
MGGVLLGLQGCAPVATFRCPEVLAPGEKAVGIGLVAIDWRGPGEHVESLPSAWFRSSIADKTDIGVSIGAFGSAFDVKHLLVGGPVLVSADLGFSYGADDIFGDPTVIVAPGIMVGTDRLYGGAWGAYTPFGKAATASHGISLGASVGGRLRLLGEYDYFKRGHDDVPSSAFGVALQWEFGGSRT